VTPIDFGGGMIFPNSYGRDQPDGPDPCDECGGAGEIPAEWSIELVMVECPECHGTGRV
jgi:DnaJ-class molecular chaperone